jgi:hypothetical protein
MRSSNHYFGDNRRYWGCVDHYGGLWWNVDFCGNKDSGHVLTWPGFDPYTGHVLTITVDCGGMLIFAATRILAMF